MLKTKYYCVIEANMLATTHAGDAQQHKHSFVVILVILFSTISWAKWHARNWSVVCCVWQAVHSRFIRFFFLFLKMIGLERNFVCWKTRSASLKKETKELFMLKGNAQLLVRLYERPLNILPGHLMHCRCRIILIHWFIWSALTKCFLSQPDFNPNSS